MDVVAHNYALAKAEQWTSLEDDSGRVVDAKYWLHLLDEATVPPTEAVYSFEAVLLSHYPEWYLEKVISGDVEPDYPFIVPDETVESVGLREYVETTFLNPREPREINKLGQFLVRLPIEE